MCFTCAEQEADCGLDLEPPGAQSLWTSRAGGLASDRSQQNDLQPPRDCWEPDGEVPSSPRAPGLGVEQMLTEHLLWPKEGWKTSAAQILPFKGFRRVRYAGRY